VTETNSGHKATSEVDLVEQAGRLADFLTDQCFHLQQAPLEQNPECCAARRHAVTAIQLADEVERLRKQLAVRPMSDGTTHWEGCWKDRGHHACSLAENDRLREELADIQNSERIILAEDCPTDEVHCGCVATLRGEVEGLRVKVDSEGAVLAMAVDRLGGIVEGHATARLNFLQRIDELRDIEHRFRCLEGKEALDGQGGESGA